MVLSALTVVVAGKSGARLFVDDARGEGKDADS